MAAPAFDTHKFVIKLKKSGFCEPKAKGLTDALNEMYKEWRPVSCEYLNERLKATCEHLDNRLKTDREYSQECLDKDLTHLNKRLDTVEKHLNERLEVSEKRLNERFDVERKYTDARLKAEISGAKSSLIKWTAGLLLAQVGLIATLIKLMAAATA